jgi:DNA repair exonuclease SbcCD ATPase subunit
MNSSVKNVDMFDADEWNFVLNKILLHYKDGKARYIPEKSSQDEKYRNAKKNCKKAIVEAMTNAAGKDFHKVAYGLLLEYAQLQDTGYQSTIIERLVKEKDELIRKLKKLNQQPNNVENLAEALAMNKMDEWKKHYICQNEDVNKLKQLIKDLHSKISSKNDIINDQNQAYKELEEKFQQFKTSSAFEMAETVLAKEDKGKIGELKNEIKKLKEQHKEEIKELKSKGSSCDDKKLKLMLIELQKKNNELQDEILHLKLDM